MERKRKFKGILATALILSMMMQLVAGAAPVYTWEEPSETWREETGLQKTISVSESEIRDSLKAWKWADRLDEDIIPFEEPRKEAAIEVLEQQLEGTVIVRQEELGDSCSAIVAVRAEEKRKNADIHNVILIGLNGNENQACEFVLEIVNEGGIVVKRMAITEYGTPVKATPSDATPSDATPSDATPSEATESDAGQSNEETDEELLEGEEDIMLINDLFPEAEDYVEAEDLSTSSNSKATSSNYNKEDTDLFVRNYTYALEPNEINGMMVNAEETEEEKPNLFMRIARLFSPGEGSEDSASLATGSNSNLAEKEDGAADAESIPAVMYAMPGSMVIGETADEITTYQGNRMYFVNMYDPLFAPELLLKSADGDRDITYAVVEAVFTQPGGGNEEMIVPMSYYDDGVYVCKIPQSKEEVDYENAHKEPDPSETPDDIIKKKMPYTKVTFRMKVQETGDMPSESELQPDENGYIRIERTYRFLGKGSPTAPNENMGTFEYLPIDRDTFFYNGRNYANNINTSYWGAHPVRTPETLDGEFIYFDVRERDGNGKPISGEYVTEMKPDGEPDLWLHYGDCDGTTNCNKNHKIRLKTTTDGIYYYQFPYESGADEDTVLVLRGKGEGPNSGQKPGFPFTWSLREDRNMVVLNNLIDGGKKWDNYVPSFLEGERYIGFDNTLVGFNPGKDTNVTNDPKRDQVMAVLWECDTPNIEEGSVPDPAHPHGAWDEEAFLKLCTETTEKEIWHLESESDGTETGVGSVYVAMLKPTRAEDKDLQDYSDEMWNQVKTVWGIRLPEGIDWDHTHVRFVRYTGEKDFYSDKNGYLVNADESTPSTDKQIQLQMDVLEELKNQLTNSIGKDTNSKGEPVYKDEGIHEFSQILTVDNSFDYPCFYTAPGHNTRPMHGYWDRLRSPNRLGDESLNIPKGDFKFDSNVYYGNATFYDYYSDYELTGHNRAKYLAVDNNDNEVKENPYPVTKKGELAVLKGKYKNDTDKDLFSQQAYTLNTAIRDYYEALDPNVTGAPGESLYFGSITANRSDDEGIRIDPLLDVKEGTDDDDKFVQWIPHAVTRKERNDWDAAYRVVGIMSNTLDEKGNLVTKSGKGTPYFSESFLRGKNSQNLAIGKVFNNVLFPFQKDESGYWSFDSTKPSHAVRMKQDNQSDMYFLDQGIQHEVEFNHPANPEYIFMPFSGSARNSKDPQKGKIPYGTYSDTPQKYDDDRGYSYLDYLLGMKISIPFTLPEDGQVEMPVLNNKGKPTGETQKEDVVFRFSGDDDVWIFVDDRLVLDIGGIHNFITGEINFGDRTITYRNHLGNDNYINNRNYQNSTNPNLNTDGSIKWSEVPEPGEGGWNHAMTYDWSGNPLRKKEVEENGNIIWEINPAHTTKPKDSIVNSDFSDFKNEGQHEITIFYLERGLIASNLRLTFNFTMNNSFEVKNEVDISNIHQKVEDRTMDPRFEELAKQIDSFNFNIQTAATKGVSKPVTESLGYIKAGGTENYNTLENANPNMVGPHWGNTTEKPEDPNDKTVSDVWIAGVDSGDRAIFKSWGVTDTHVEEKEIERRLINIYPPDGISDVKAWPEEIPSGNIGEGSNSIDTPATYMSLQVYNPEEDVSENGSILYVGLIDKGGHRVGGWANTLTHGEASNRIGHGWNTIRINKEKLWKTGDGDVFNMEQIQAVQLCYFDEREGAVRNIKFHGEPDLSQELNGFYVRDEDISDYGSIIGADGKPAETEETDGIHSELKPAYGAWYNTESYVHEAAPNPEEKPEITADGQPPEEADPPEANNYRQPVMVGEEGKFQLGPDGSALFTDKFRVGSYIAVNMEELNPRIFTTTWTLTEDGERIQPSWLSANANTQNLKYEQITVNPWEQPGRSPRDGRHQRAYAAHTTIVNNNNGKNDAGQAWNPDLESPNSDTILYRSYQYPDESSNGFRIGVNFNTVMDTARIVVKKELLKGTEAEKDGYNFAIVYDDIADMGLELNLKNSFVAQGFTLRAGEAKCLDVLAGTHYRIYELNAPLKYDETSKTWKINEKEPTSIEDLLPYISRALESVTTGWAEPHGSNDWDIRETEKTNHMEVTAYSKGADSSELISNGHASGIAYTKDQQGKDGRGDQGFVFTNGPAPKPGKGSVTLKKVDKETGKALPGAEFALYYLNPNNNNEPELWMQQTTDESGEITVTDLPFGEYYFVETKAPGGYRPPDGKHHKFTIDKDTPNLQESIEVSNAKITEQSGRLILTKKDADSKTNLAGAVFDLYRWDSEDLEKAPDIKPWEETTNPNKWVLDQSDLVTDADGKLLVDRLPYGYYALHETTPPTGYILPKEEEDRWVIFEIINEEFVVQDKEMMNLSEPIARFRVEKVVESPHQNSGDQYRDDPFLIKVKGATENVSDFYSELVLRDWKHSDYIIVDLGDERSGNFKIQEIIPMEYELIGMEKVNDKTGDSVLEVDPDTGIGTLTIKAGADVIVRVKNKEKHIDYFHDMAYVTNTASGEDWKFTQKSRDPDGLDYDGNPNPLAFLLPNEDRRHGKKEEEEQKDSAE